MKKFFKALAVVLALTLVIGTIPAAADVTIDATKVKKEKILYLGGTKGFKTEADGTKKMSRYGEKASYWKLLGITKEQAEELGVTATTSKEEVASVNDTSMKVIAQAMGEATITLKAGDATYPVTLTVKKSAEKVIFGADFAGVEDKKNLTVNKEYTLSVPRFDNGVKMDTDQRTIEIKDKDGNVVTDTYAKKVVDEKNPKKDTRTWTVTFTATGDYTIYAKAYQSKKYFPGATAEKTISVTVATPVPQELKQIASNAFKFTFEEGVKIDEKDFQDKIVSYEDAIYYLVNEKKVPFSLIKSVAHPKDADGNDIENEVVVTMFSNFVGGETYYVDFGEGKFDFVAAGNGIKDVTSIVVETTKVPALTNAPVVFKLYNSLGIDITPAIDVDAYVSVDCTSDDAFMAELFKIYFTETGKTAKVVVTLHAGYDDAGSELTVKSPETVITSFDGADIGTVKYSIVRNPDNETYINQWTASTKNDFAIGDDAYLQILIKNKADEWVSLADAGISSVKAADGNYFAIDTLVSNERTAATQWGFELSGTNPGTSAVILYREKNDGTEYPVYSLPITVKARRTLSKASVTLSQAYLNTQFANDFIDFKVTFKDQYDEGYDNIDIEARQNDTNKAQNGAITFAVGQWSHNTWEPGVYTYRINSADLPAIAAGADDKSAPFQVIFEGVDLNTFATKAATIGFTGGNEDDAATTWQVRSTSNALDTNYEYETWQGAANFEVWGYNGKYAVSKETLNRMEVIPTKTASTPAIVAKIGDGTSYAGAETFVYVLKYNGKIMNLASDNIAGYLTDAFIRNITLSDDHGTSNVLGFSTFAANGTAAVKLPAGNYVIDFYRIQENAADANITDVKKLGTKNLQVTNNQTKPTFTKKRDICDGTDADALACFEFKMNGTVDSIIDVAIHNATISATNGTYYVKSVYVTYKDKNFGDRTFTIDLPVEKLLKIQ